MDRIGMLREYAINKLKTQARNERSLQAACAHLYGVSYMCALIAAKRKENTELATIAGMLHDIASFILSDVTPDNHAAKSAKLALKWMSDINVFSEEEKTHVYNAILNHNDKLRIDSKFDEILKDADVMAHALFNLPMKNFLTYRWNDLVDEFNLII